MDLNQEVRTTVEERETEGRKWLAVHALFHKYKNRRDFFDIRRKIIAITRDLLKKQS